MNQGELIIYVTEDGKASLDVHLDHDTVWLTQEQMSELFGKTVPTINEHIKNTFKEGELEEEAVIRNFRITAADGKTYDTAHYSLDVIISVGYRVKSQQGTRFRQWATKTLRDHIVKGYTFNEQRLREQHEKLAEMRPNVFYSFRAASPEVYADFYSHFFASGGLNHQLSRVINTGVRNDGLLNLNASDFFDVKVPFPPAAEQERIAKILTLTNDELDLLRTQLDSLREQKKGLMQQLLTGKVRVKV